MAKFIGSTNLTYLWGKLKAIFATKTEVAKLPSTTMYMGTCSTAANTYAKEATVETFPLDANNKPIEGTIVGVKYANSNTYKTEGHTYTLNVNGTGAFPMYYNNAALATSTSANTLVAGYKNRYTFYMFNGSQWVFISASYDANSTYSAMTQAEVDAGTGTTGRTITPKILRDNFYTESEVNNLIPTVPTNVSDFNNDAGYITSYTETDPVFTASAAHGISSSDITNWNGKGTYSKPSGGIPDTDLSSAVQTSLGKADTALQSFTESDPVFEASAAHGISSSDISNWNSKTSNVGTITGINMNGASKGTSGVVDLGTVITAHQTYSEIVGAPQYIICTQADYDAMASHDSNTYYLILA